MDAPDHGADMHHAQPLPARRFRRSNARTRDSQAPRRTPAPATPSAEQPDPGHEQAPHQAPTRQSILSRNTRPRHKCGSTRSTHPASASSAETPGRETSQTPHKAPVPITPSAQQPGPGTTGPHAQPAHRPNPGHAPAKPQLDSTTSRYVGSASGTTWTCSTRPRRLARRSSEAASATSRTADSPFNATSEPSGPKR